jgi:uncharacterized protein (TIGR02646 family)
MIYINNTTISPNAKWLKKAQELTDALVAATTHQERKDIIDKNHRIWKLLKDGLKVISYGKCWYSEAREIFSHYHVDHFRPKLQALNTQNVDQGGYWWLAFDWTNYRLSGSVGNTKKGDYFPVKRHKCNNPNDPIDDELCYFLDPTNKDDVKLLNFNEDGKAVPSVEQATAQWSYERADETITWFDLNYDSLKEERKRIWKNLVLEILETQILLDDYENNQSVALREKIKSKFEEFRKKIAPCTELSATIRCCLRSCGFNWALRLVEEEIDPKVYCKEFIKEDK